MLILSLYVQLEQTYNSHAYIDLILMLMLLLILTMWTILALSCILYLRLYHLDRPTTLLHIALQRQ